ncbi:DNA repair exonuclease [Giesbergeria giesbergeri]
MQGMKFIHAADIHLDSPLRGLSAYPDAPAERLRTATRDALEQLVSRAMDEAVDFMVIAGDLYDGDWRDFNTGLFLVRQMGRLRQAGIDVYLLYGNHDADSEITKRLELPDNVHVFSSSKAQTLRIPPLQVALHGRSFKQAATTENLAASYPPPVPGWFNIGVLHTALEGSTSHASYAPCSVAELDAKGYQYWALGHVHTQWVRQGEPTIAFPGNLQGRHIRETGPHGALLITVDAGDVRSIEPLWVDVLRWAELVVDVSGCSDWAGAVRAVGQSLQGLLAQQVGERPLAVRVQLQGRSTVHTALLAQPTQLRQEVLAQAIALDAERLWIEKVCVQTQAPVQVPAHQGDGLAALATLHGLALGALEDADFLQELRRGLAPLWGRLPAEVLAASPELQALRDGPIETLLADTLPLLLARVEQKEV